ncbi:MAG: copper amine oxidase N-terminal domain-containing protein [Bacillota bacterium]|nr:copper amine oxidase N-terminal domain-containing protein [Bacillota bacterium]
MKKLSLVLALVLLLTTSMVFAEDLVTEESQEQVVAEEVVTDEVVAEEEATEEVSEKKGKGQLKQEAKAKWEIEKDEVESVKDENEASYETLKEQYEALMESGDEAGAALLVSELDALKVQFVEAKAAMKQIMEQRKLIARSEYTVEEMATFDAAVESITSVAEVSKVLSVGSVFVKKNLIKFDTPAYIKGGRTVVPVRAITEGLGAEVSFNPETFEVTIVKGDTTIILSIGSNVAIVNGETVELDSQSEITNSRTYVPIRFIAETFGLTVDWDAETETIDIEDSVEEVLEEVQE